MADRVPACSEHDRGQVTGPAPAVVPLAGGPPTADLAAAASVGGRLVDYGAMRPVPARIEAQARLHPDRVAVRYAGRAITYAELDQLAGGLAARVRDCGIGKGDSVATLLVNSLELPVTYLALMKLGAVFVPMDPGWPAPRLRAALTVLAPRLVISAAGEAAGNGAAGNGAAAGNAAAGSDAPVLRVSLEDLPVAALPAVPLAPQDRCYGFFTSGTTGIPKCAMNLHGGLANRLEFMTRYFGAPSADVVLQNSKHTFDSSLWQLLWPLTGGGQVVLPAAGEFLNLQQTVATIGEHRVTAADFVSSVFNQLVALVAGDERAVRMLASLRFLIVGSEEINAKAVHRMRALLPGLRITNGYGPTETTIGMAFHTVSDADGDRIPLGAPIDNCFAAVLGPGKVPAPRGSVGEIAIGGACMGAGYHGDGAATAAAFTPNPVPGLIPGERIYLTGDLGHMDAHGRLFFAGRSDFQVKIGGVRIELGEIEAAAQQCPGVSHAKALAGGRDELKSLALFAAGDPSLSDARLRDHLRQVLPRTSMPRYVMVLDRMPLGEVGKIDWRRLQAILDRKLDADAVELAAADGRAQSAGSWLELVLGAFRVALAQPGLPADADFMAAGGDSIRALIAVRRLCDECGVPDLCVQDLLEHPTATRLARLIATREPSCAAADAEAAQLAVDAAPGQRMVIGRARRDGELRTVLVTGATGFVGSRLVHDLLSRTDLRLACPARAPSDTEAAQRVAAALMGRGLWRPGFAARIDGYAADLGQPGLGLAPAAWDHLAGTCDLVLHNGSLVNLLFSYAAHRAPNVTGTAELLRLAMAGRPVPFHFVSTLSALQAQAVRRASARPAAGPLPEIGCPSAAAPPARGYSRSKWVAERYLDAVRRRGALVTVLRLGEVLPSQAPVHPNDRALTHLLLAGVHRLGCYPDAAIKSDYTPVDYACARIAAAVTDRAAWGRTLHVLHPHSVSFAAALASVGAPLTQVSCAQFLAMLGAAADQAGAGTAGAAALAALAALLPRPEAGEEPVLRQALDRLLTDNPALYRKDECRRLEQRCQLTDPDLSGPISAYRAYLDQSACLPAGRP